jgi:hypothetical protein
MSAEDHRKLVELHAVAKRLREALAANADAAILAELDAALESTDPNVQRRATPLGARILDAADEAGFDEHRLGEAAGLPAGALKRLLYHELRNVRIEHLEAVAKTLGVEVEWVRTGNGERRKKAYPPAAAFARRMGMPEDIIRAVLDRDGDVERSDEDWLAAFEAETKGRSAPEPAESGTIPSVRPK